MSVLVDSLSRRSSCASCRGVVGVLFPLLVVMALVVATGVVLTSASARTRGTPPCEGPPKAVLYVYRLDMPAIAEHVATAQRSNEGWAHPLSQWPQSAGQ